MGEFLERRKTVTMDANPIVQLIEGRFNSMDARLDRVQVQLTDIGLKVSLTNGRVTTLEILKERLDDNCPACAILRDNRPLGSIQASLRSILSGQVTAAGHAAENADPPLFSQFRDWRVIAGFSIALAVLVMEIYRTLHK
jgi:hypothetical protein